MCLVEGRAESDGVGTGPRREEGLPMEGRKREVRRGSCWQGRKYSLSQTLMNASSGHSGPFV